MRMKIGIREIYKTALFLLLLIFQACERDSNFSIVVNFKLFDSTAIKLYHLTEEDAELIDSVFVSEQSAIKLEGKTEYPALYLLEFFNDQSIFLVIHPRDKINLEINNLSEEISYYVKGSYDSRLVKEITDQQSIVLKKIDQLSQAWEINRTDSLLLRKIDSSYSTLLKEHQNYTRKFIYDNPGSLACVLALYQNFGRKSQPLFDRYDDLDIFNFVDSSLSVLYPYTEAVKALNREVTETKEQIVHNKYIEKRIVEGGPLPNLIEITLAGDTIISNKEISIPTLLCFWATWNSFSANEVVALDSFLESNEAGRIQIITISLDSSEERLREFIIENRIELPVISDFKYWDSELAARYAVKRIPATILTNKEGIVIAKDLFSDELISKLKEVGK